MVTDPWLQRKLQSSYFVLKKTLEGKADLTKQTSRRPLYAAVTLRLEPRARDFGYRCTLALPPQDIDDHDQRLCIDAVFDGALDALWTHHLHPIRDVEIFLTRFFYDKPQSARIIFWEAGRDAVRHALEFPGGVGMTEHSEMWELVSRG